MEIYLFVLQGIEWHENKNCLFESFVCLTSENTLLLQAGAVKDYIKMMLDNDKLKFLVFAHHLSMLQACTEAVIESKVKPEQMCTQI